MENLEKFVCVFGFKAHTVIAHEINCLAWVTAASNFDPSAARTVISGGTCELQGVGEQVGPNLPEHGQIACGIR